MAVPSTKAKSPGISGMAIRVKAKLLKGTQSAGSSVSWFQSMKSGMPGRRLDRRTRWVGSLELQVHGHAISAQPKEDALPQAQDSAVPPADDQAERHERVSQILAYQVEAEDVERQREYQQQNDSENDEGSIFTLDFGRWSRESRAPANVLRPIIGNSRPDVISSP